MQIKAAQTILRLFGSRFYHYTFQNNLTEVRLIKPGLSDRQVKAVFFVKKEREPVGYFSTRWLTTVLIDPAKSKNGIKENR